MAAAISYLQDDNRVMAASIADQANEAACIADCNPETGEKTYRSEGETCAYSDVGYVMSHCDLSNVTVDCFLSGTCQAGKCQKGDSFVGYFVWQGNWNDSDVTWSHPQLYPCDTPETVVTDDTFSVRSSCPNRKMTSLDGDGYALFSLGCPDDSFAIRGSYADCALCADPHSYIPENPSECLACGNRHIDANGHCVMDHCPTGYFRGGYFCIACDERDDPQYEFEVTYAVSSKANCDKCAQDGAHARTYNENGMCRY